MKSKWISILAGLLVLAFALPFLKTCQNTPPIVGTNPVPTKPQVSVRKSPNFQADSAYQYIEKQLSFGFRTPNSKGHDACANWLVATFKRLGADVLVQSTKVTAHDGKELAIQNIIASYNTQAQNRVMLSAHWDSRPWADEDSVNKDKPILAANDAGSGVGILLEIARQIQTRQPTIGIDIMLWDAEDYGKNESNSYCLGAQYWATHKHKTNYSAMYGINLDMVGAEGAQFPKEGVSLDFASPQTQKLWNIATEMGYGNFFPFTESSPITDDHLFVNTMAKIPMIDIIDRRPDPLHTGEFVFFPYWHKHKDDMTCISKNTLEAVGQTVMEMIYREE